ncbi:helix-turn-helix transcriptional regulator [Streptomyces sp. BI20]|uniref:helix-turn-helix transcriptional regulator n=1 Tax=Streptomyces sp. BI20 TaxID=3403460 RepID=UPI003C72DB18
MAGPTKMLKLEETLEVLQMSRASFYRLRARGNGPRIVKLPNGHLRVRQSDLDSWLRSCEEVLAC